MRLLLHILSPTRVIILRITMGSPDQVASPGSRHRAMLARRLRNAHSYANRCLRTRARSFPAYAATEMESDQPCTGYTAGTHEPLSAKGKQCRHEWWPDRAASSLHATKAWCKVDRNIIRSSRTKESHSVGAFDRASMLPTTESPYYLE